MLPVSQNIATRADSVSLTATETTRYSRHLLLPEVGISGQRRLKAARVLVIGAGGLGSPVSLYLAAAGVGTLGIVEFDTVDTSNLQRQVLYTEADAGKSKLDAATARLSALNAAIQIVRHPVRLDPDNAAEIFSDYDIIVDGTDNFPARYLASDSSVLLGKPYVYGSIFRFDGQASVFYAPHGPCYRCLFPSPPPAGQVPSCSEGGVLGVLPAQIGSIQANETIKLILGIGTSLLGRLMTLNALDMRVEEFRIRRDPDCPACGERPSITSLSMSAQFCTPVQEVLPAAEEIDVAAYRRLRDSGAKHLLLDVRSANEAAICAIEGSRLIPVGDLEGRVDELPRDMPIVVHCKSGARSMRAAALLATKGFVDVRSLRGGILAWIAAYAPEMPKY